MTDARVRQICAVLPQEVADAVLALPPGRRETLEEVRLRRGCEITAVFWPGGRRRCPWSGPWSAPGTPWSIW